ncbi:MAG: NusG domain II-containing protein [bacterium]
MLTLGDKLLIGALLAIGLFSLLMYPGVRSQGAYAVVESEGNSICRLDFSQDQEVLVMGPLGETVVEVRDGRVRVKRSPCPHSICVQRGFRDRDGDVIACIPNKVVVQVMRGERGEGVDGVTR